MKSFKEFIVEMPQINTFLDKDRMDDLAKQYRHLHKEYSGNTTDVGHGIQHRLISGNHHYFTKDNEGGADAISVITKDNVQKFAHKGTGTQKDIHSFMLHHAEKHGEVKSDASNTEGSKKLWKDLVKSKPANKSFYYEDSNSKAKVPVDHSNIDEHEDKIWGKSTKMFDVRIGMSHNDK